MRRGLSWWAGLCGLLLVVCRAGAATGVAVPELAAFDSQVQAFMQRWNLTGGAVAVTRNGRLVLARGYGVTDAGGSTPVQPDTLFRLASLSKPITAIAVMKLVQDGALSLDLRVFPYLALGPASDSRMNSITVRHLLEHTGGWDRDVAGDPVFDARRIAQTMGVPSPPDAQTLLRHMLRQPLQYEPGTRYAYSNFGYVVLGEVVAKASGQRYDDFLRTLMLQAGVQRARIGASLPAGRLPGEAGYVMPAGASVVSSVFDSQPGQVPFPYGGFALEPLAAAGGWVASAIDLVAIASLVDGVAHRPDLLNATTLAEMKRRPGYDSGQTSSWYAKGWQVNTFGNIFHQGSLPGTSTLLASLSNGTQWAAVFNGRSDSNRSEFSTDLDGMMVAAYRAVTQWPEDDRFAALLGPAAQPGCFGHASFAGGVLCIPDVEVPVAGAAAQRYTATLSLSDSTAFEFTLTHAAPAPGPGASTSRFDAASGAVSLPRVVLTDPSGVARAYRVELTLVPGPGPLRFRLKSAVPL